jgi:hypothetical protein
MPFSISPLGNTSFLLQPTCSLLVCLWASVPAPLWPLCFEAGMGAPPRHCCILSLRHMNCHCSGSIDQFPSPSCDQLEGKDRVPHMLVFGDLTQCPHTVGLLRVQLAHAARGAPRAPGHCLVLLHAWGWARPMIDREMEVRLGESLAFPSPGLLQKEGTDSLQETPLQCWAKPCTPPAFGLPIWVPSGAT